MRAASARLLRMRRGVMKKWYLLALAVVVVLPYIGWFLDWPVLTKLRAGQCRDQYEFVNMDVVCGSPDVIRKTGYQETQDLISSYIDAEKATGHLTEASVYFRDLVHGPTFGINELNDFAPASLLKLPLAFVFLASAEAQPELLTTKLSYVGTTSVPEQRVQPLESAEPYKEYEIQELLRMMIVYSDNASYEALEAFLSGSNHRSNLRREIFQEIGLINPQDRIEETITTRGYASLFRILYNVSFLEPALSERLLGWLAESTYDAGIEAGVPASVRVAHKFGERIMTDSHVKQLHDCGIVYYTDNPYLLCIMTKGSDWTSLEKTIATVSSMVYEEVHSRRI